MKKLNEILYERSNLDQVTHYFRRELDENFYSTTWKDDISEKEFIANNLETLELDLEKVQDLIDEAFENDETNEIVTHLDSIESLLIDDDTVINWRTIERYAQTAYELVDKEEYDYVKAYIALWDLVAILREYLEREK